MYEPWLPALARSSHSTPRQLLVAGSSHRKIANPLPNGTYAFASTTLLLSLYNLHVQEVQVPNGVLTLSLMFGGMSQLLAGLWEFASGNTFGGTLFVSYGCFWWGYSISECVGCAQSRRKGSLCTPVNIPFFGMVGEYDGQPGIYSATGLGAAEESNAIGLFLWIWFGITTLCEWRANRAGASLKRPPPTSPVFVVPEQHRSRRAPLCP